MTSTPNKKYLFFDIECSNGYTESSKMCSFGYVLTDDKFNIIQEVDIFMNPSGRFKLTDRKNRADLKLKYPESFFREQEKFPYYYDEIKELLEDPNTIVIGYSTDNDVRYILTELLYYELKPINFKYYDVQEIFDDEFDFYDCVSLSNASELLGLCKQDDEHDSLSDAKMTMDVCKKLANELNVSFEQLLAKYEIKEFKDYRLLSENDEPIRVLSSFRLYKYYINQPGEPIPYVNGKNFCFSKSLEDSNIGRMINLYKIVTDAGGLYNPKISDCDFFVSCDEIVENDIRYNAAKHNNIPIIPYGKFLTIIGTNNEELDSINPLKNMIKQVQKNPWVENHILMMKEKEQVEVSSSIGEMFADFFKDFQK